MIRRLTTTLTGQEAAPAAIFVIRRLGAFATIALSPERCPMEDLVLFCKSYSGDVLRAERLASSLARHNRENIPVFFGAPDSDVSLFQARLSAIDPRIRIVSDESIVQANPRAALPDYIAMPGQLSQQVVKSEFWRWAMAQGGSPGFNYVCMDSESEFIRDFGKRDFLHADGTPFTVMHQNDALLELALRKRAHRVIAHFRQDCARMKKVFGRDGPDYSFGPTPVVWSAKVWQCLDDQWLRPRNMTLWDAVRTEPSELHWYGETLLHFRPIPVHPVGPLFRVYHYNWEYYAGIAAGETVDSLRGRFIGILKQSSWEYELDAGQQARRKSLGSRIARSVRRFLSRYR